MNITTLDRHLILASSSTFRKLLLERLNISFSTDSPNIDETQRVNESPETYVRRLSLEKAQAVASRHENAIIIASDQCCVLNNAIHSKPESHSNAIEQLRQSSGNIVSFLTGLCVLDTQTGTYEMDVIPTDVYFRDLSLEEIERYLKQEEPYQCAGSFMAEGLGISLFRKLQSEDPTALIGLPLIRLCEMLRNLGLSQP